MPIVVDDVPMSLSVHRETRQPTEVDNVSSTGDSEIRTPQRPVISFRVRRRLFATSGTSGLGSQTEGLNGFSLGLHTPAGCQSIVGNEMLLDNVTIQDSNSHSDISMSTATTLTLYSE